MEMVLITAIGVGGATLFGSLIGFVFKNISHRWGDIITSFAAGVMLAAAVFGLVLPSVEYGGNLGLVYAVTGIFVGAFCLTLIDKLVPHMHGIVLEDESKAAEVNRTMLFVTAIAIHNLPEGIA
ncbi:MAG: ZIP family metal transporter, partial [Clostridia bacterium]|nr:ZIP family metal transporter [Clostridia bacterium]